MGLFKSKEQKELEKQMKSEKEEKARQFVEAAEKKKNEYKDECDKIINSIPDYVEWLNATTLNFAEEIESQGIVPSFGFEREEGVVEETGFGGQRMLSDCYFFDIPKCTGIAFDNKSQKVIYYSREGGMYYKNYRKYCDQNLMPNFEDKRFDWNKNEIIYQYNILDYTEIVGVKLKKISSHDMHLTVQTTRDELSVLNFQFTGLANTATLCNTLYSTFSKFEELFELRLSGLKRNFGTQKDIIIQRKNRRTSENPDDFIMVDASLRYLDLVLGGTSNLTFYLEILEKRLGEYVDQIEALIKKQTISEGQGNMGNMIGITGELEKLVKLKMEGSISSEEFDALKSKLINS